MSSKGKKQQKTFKKQAARIEQREEANDETKEEGDVSDNDNQLLLNPAFSFEFSGGGLTPKVATWHSSVKRGIPSSMPSHYTTIDEKIELNRHNLDDDNDDKVEEINREELEALEAVELAEQESIESNDEAESDIESTTNNDHSSEDGEEQDEAKDLVRDKRAAEYFAPEVAIDHLAPQLETFTELRLSRPILKGVSGMGFVKPTPIQANSIPLAMKGQDICGAAVTGSGKTAAFVIPILERLLFRPKNNPTTRVLILVPTRELGAQCHAVTVNLAKFTDIQISLCLGGLPSKIQEQELRKRPDIVIATPGRLIDHIHNSPSFNLDSIEILVIDEADRIMDDGFASELKEIIRNCPKGRQTMLFSATMTDNVDDLIKLSLNRPVRLFVNSATSLTSRLTQEFIRIRNFKEDSKAALLASLCSRTYQSECIIFFKSKADAHSMKVVFGLLGLKAAELHGNLNQIQRLEALESFRDKTVDFLLATDLASRGLDIAGIKTVINYDMPSNYPLYVHRVGRTARAGLSGRAVSLVTEADRKVLKLAVKNAGKESSIKNRIIPSSVVAKYATKIAGMRGSISNIQQQEKEDGLLQRAEMEVTKAGNILTHSEEIQSRPRREWFQSQEDNAIQKDKGVRINPESKSKDKEPRSALDGLSRKKKRMRMLLAEEDKVEIKSQKIAARKSKASVRPGKLSSKPGKAPGGKRSTGAFDRETRSSLRRKK